MDIIKLNRDWHLGTQLGTGGFGRVYLARSDEYGDQAVIKRPRRKKRRERREIHTSLMGVKV